MRRERGKGARVEFFFLASLHLAYCLNHQLAIHRLSNTSCSRGSTSTIERVDIQMYLSIDRYIDIFLLHIGGFDLSLLKGGSGSSRRRRGKKCPHKTSYQHAKTRHAGVCRETPLRHVAALQPDTGIHVYVRNTKSSRRSKNEKSK